MKLGVIDLTVLVIYFLSQIAVGLWVGRKNKSTEQYFLAGKSFSGFFIGISFIGSIVSSSTFMAFPADAFKSAWLRFALLLPFPAVTFLAAWLLVPFFRRGTITSAYQYLALRFGNSISVYAAVTFILLQLLRTSMIAYLLSLLVSEMTGLSYFWSLLLIVGATAVYTVKGGLKAVLWTDVIQTFVLLAGGIACVVFVLSQTPGGIAGMFSSAVEHHKFSFGDLNAAGELAPTKWFGGFQEKSVFMIFMIGLISFVGQQFDQSTVQRWCSARSAPDARKSMYVLGIGCMPVWALFYFLGSCLFVYFLNYPDAVSTGVLSGAFKAERILPHFIMTHLSGGLAGLVIAGAFAAGMSTLSACINVSSMVAVGDIYGKFAKGTSDGRRLFLGKALSLGIAAFMILGAWIIYKADMLTLTNFMMTAGMVFVVGIPVVFLAGILTRRVGTAAVWAGLGAGILFMAWALLSSAGKLPAWASVKIPEYYASIAGNLIALAVAGGVSIFVKPRERDLTNLTVWDQEKKPLV